MGFLLLCFLGCFVAAPQDYAILSVNATTVTDTFAVGKPYQKAKWKTTPTIRVCATTGVSTYRAAQAARYWESIGYVFKDIRKDPFSTCMNPRVGEIIVTLPEVGFADSHMASTKIYTDKETGVIVKAKIHILPKHARKDRVLEHELGHALGWMHYRQKFHIMHPNWHQGGYDHSGIRK
jgi:hypothetical protein